MARRQRRRPEDARSAPRSGSCGVLLALLAQTGTTHVACAFDHVVESFRNDLFPGYKTGEGVDPELLGQFELVEQAVAALGVVVWPMVEFEADDALAAGAARFRDELAVDQVLICSPDKDLAQAVSGTRVVCWDRRRDIVLDEQGVEQKFGVRPEFDPGLARPGRRLGRRLSGDSGLGRQVSFGGPQSLRPPGKHPAGSQPMGLARCPRRSTGREPEKPRARGVAVSPPGDAAPRRPAAREPGRPRVARRPRRPAGVVRRLGRVKPAESHPSLARRVSSADRRHRLPRRNFDFPGSVYLRDATGAYR